MKRNHIIALVVFFVLVALVISLSPRKVQKMQGSFLGMLSPFLKTGSSLQVRVSKFTEGLQTLRQLETDNKRLSVQNKNLKATNLLLNDLSQENKQLRKALNYRERSIFRLIPARVVTRDSTTWWNTVKIDRGAEDGIRPDMAVLTEEGMVGKTTAVGPRLSVVLLVADETCKIAAKVEGTREQGILSGSRTSTSKTPLLQLKYLTRDAGLRPGQTVYSSGLGGVFPSGVRLGTVKKFEVKELEGRAAVIPSVDLSKLRDVFVVVGRNE